MLIYHFYSLHFIHTHACTCIHAYTHTHTHTHTHILLGQNPSPSSNISSPDTDPSLSNSTPPARQCSKGFFLDISGFCMPECGEWEELPHGVVVTHDVIVGLQAIFYLVVATIALICSGIQYERM